MKLGYKILLLVVLCAVGSWSYRLYRQNKQLDQAGQSVFVVMSQINQGHLRSADEVLRPVEMIASTMQNEWAALPYVRRKEQILSAHANNLRRAYGGRVNLIDVTAREVIVLTHQGRMKEAGIALGAAVKECSQAEENLKALSKFLDRLSMQDFKGAEEAAARVAAQLTEHTPLSEEGKIALTTIADVVQIEKKANYTAHARIASEVKRLINLSSTREAEQFKPLLKGKAMIWDATKDQVEMAYELLPDNLRASNRDGVVTIFSVMRRENILMGHYTISKQPAYKEKMTIGVVYWPAQVNAGTAVVWGGDPPQLRPVTYVPGYGSSVNIKGWVASLPTK